MSVSPDARSAISKFPGFRFALIAAILGISLVTIPADFAIAFDDGSAPANVGSLDDYVRQGQPRDREYAPRGSHMGGAAELLWRPNGISLANQSRNHGRDDADAMGSTTA